MICWPLCSSIPLAIFIVNLDLQYLVLHPARLLPLAGAAADNSPLRQRYLLSYLLCMGLGTLVLGTHLLIGQAHASMGCSCPGPIPMPG